MAKTIGIYLKVTLVTSLLLVSFVGKSCYSVDIPVTKKTSEKEKKHKEVVVSDDFNATISVFDVDFSNQVYNKPFEFFVPNELLNLDDSKQILSEYIQKRILCCKISPTNAP